MRAHEFITEHRLVFKRKPKGGISLKWRCESGPRKGRTVPDVSQCSAAPDIKKAAKMKQTRQRTKVAQARKTKKTKRVNPMSKTAAMLNKKMRKGLKEDTSLKEIGYADELSNLSMTDKDVIVQSTVDGKIARRDVMKTKVGNSTLYFFSTGNKIEALVLLNNDRLVAMKNFTKNKGLIYGLFNYIVNIKQQKLIIEPNDQLTPYGIDWILKQVARLDGFKITDLAGDHINPESLKKEWNKSRTDTDRKPGSTGIVIGESSFGKKIRENETALMTYDIFGVNKKD